MFMWILWTAIVGACIWLFLKRKYSYFKDRGVNNLPPAPFIGNFLKAFIKKLHFSTNMDIVYNAFPNDRFIGSYDFTAPTVFIRDPEIIRLIGVKDFDSFSDHRSLGNENDPFFSKSLIGLKGQRWRDMRSTLSPAFTASKLKSMVPLILESNKELYESIQKKINECSDNHLDLDTHDLLTRYTNDVIATCAFGLKTNSITERDNVFYRMGRKMTTVTSLQIMKAFLYMVFPFINKIKETNVLDMDAANYLMDIVLATMTQRDEKKLFRPDMIQLLIEAKKGTLKYDNDKESKDAGFATVEESDIGKSAVKQTWGDDYLVSQALLFFFAGFDTVSTCMKFLLLELAINTDVQEKLRQEIKEHFDKYNGKIEYDTINQMKYMDMVVSETLRKWPPAINTDRVCTNSYNLGKPNNEAKKDFILEKGIPVNIPIYSLHRDAQYYPNPDKFLPERFSDDNKHNIKPFTYLPFGVGPRNCIGSRFALVEVKVMVYEIVRRFELSPAPQTIVPPRYDIKQPFTARLEGGEWLRFKIKTN